MQERIVLNVLTLLYVALTMIVYFSKKRIENVENQIYKKMLLIVPVGVILEAICNLSALFFPDTLASNIFGRLYLIFIINWVVIFSLYICVVTVLHGKSKEEYNRSIYRVLYVIFDVALSIILLFIPLKFVLTENEAFIDGMGVVVLVGAFCLYVFLDMIFTAINFKKMKIRELVPMGVLLLIMLILIVVHNIAPQIQIISSAFAFITIIMYHTIENPDMIMVQQLEVAREQADKANRAKSDFLSSMSHEIRTPLNAIVGFSDCIMDANNLGEAQENAKDIVNASQTLLEIVNGILDISKIEAGKIEIVNSKYNAPETFEELAKLITPKMNEKGLDFSYTIAPDLPMTLFGDHANIKKIVTNLLSNACKYTDRGFVHYEVNCVNTKDVSKLIISVEDSGRGIKKESVDKMFTKFQRLEEDRNTTIEGTGLGLAITKQLIELMGGRIIVHTVYGQGSKFTVVLNQKITEADAVSNKKVKTTLDLSGVKILMVDDTPLNIKVGCKLLEKYGANNIVTCDSGFECIDRISRGEVYDVILLDDMMPKMSGVETLKKLKENPNFKIPTIALTANAISGMREKYLSDGFNDYLAKPIEKNQLIQVMNQVLGRSATEDINVSEVINNNENIKTEEVSNNPAEETNPSVIPVEENIEEILGDELDMNYREKTMMKMKPISVNNIDNDNVEILDEVPSIVKPKITEVKSVEPIPLVDISSPTLTYDRKYLESNGVDVNHALELLGDMDMYNMTINDFVKDVENKWNRIVEYKNSNDMPNYAIEVHSLKSDCKYLGFMKLADVAYQHELKSKDNDSNFVNSNFEELEVEYKKVLEIAKEYVEHNKIEG